MVPPEAALVTAMIASSRGSKAEAVRVAAAASDSLTTDIAARGGVALDAGSGRRPLTWPAEATIAKGRDYAAALGGSLRGAGHIADAGLLSGDTTPSGWPPCDDPSGQTPGRAAAWLRGA